ncbi:MAG: hypothetical protein B6229_08550 [Spirochaetaceae bacterium 4572_7]|nr:MAG: hypothetical protein B6229_08550 [Spirochaetaceae bacterium 4572_7]
MEVSASAELNQEEIIKIRDVKKTLIYFGGMIAVPVMSYFMLEDSQSSPGTMAIWIGVTILLSGLFFFLFKANLNGYIINFEKQTLEFPGGGLAPNSILDYVKPNFLLQMFKRLTINLNEIQQLSESYKSVRDKEGKVTYTFYLHLTGLFGAVKLSFQDENKRDQLMGMIIQVNQMGSPVVKQ